MLAEAVVLELCRSGGLDRNIEFVKGALRERRDALVEALGEQIPEAEFVVPGGGYFLWLDLAEGTDTPALLAEAKGEGVAFVAGPDFMIEGGENSLRLSFASVPPEQIAEGVSRIARGARPGPRRLARLGARPRPPAARLFDGDRPLHEGVEGAVVGEGAGSVRASLRRSCRARSCRCRSCPSPSRSPCGRFRLRW